jgi:hypothetical protein
LANGAGLFRVLELKKGQYAFAKGDVSVGMETAASGVELNLWPNPASTELTVSANSGLDGLEVWNASGQHVIAARLPANTQQWTVDVSDWSAGTYFVRTGKGTQSFIVE